jgi:hypothetical protein
VMAVFPAEIETGHRRRNDVAHPSPLYPASRESPSARVSKKRSMARHKTARQDMPEIESQ